MALGPALHEALDGMLPSPDLPFVPGLESTLGLVVLSNVEFRVRLDPWEEALLDTLLVQQFLFSPAGGRWPNIDGGSVKAIMRLGGDGHAEAAARIVRDLHAAFDLTVESESPRIAKRGELLIACSRTDGVAAKVVTTAEGLPPLEVLQLAASENPPLSANQILERFTGRKGTASLLLQRLLPALRDRAQGKD